MPASGTDVQLVPLLRMCCVRRRLRRRIRRCGIRVAVAAAVPFAAVFDFGYLLCSKLLGFSPGWARAVACAATILAAGAVGSALAALRGPLLAPAAAAAASTSSHEAAAHKLPLPSQSSLDVPVLSMTVSLHSTVPSAAHALMQSALVFSASVGVLMQECGRIATVFPSTTIVIITIIFVAS